MLSAQSTAWSRGNPMSSYVFFASDHPVTLNWTGTDGANLTQRARLHDVSDSQLIVDVPGRERFSPPVVGGHVTAEAADAKGACLARFRGRVSAINSRQIDIRLDQAMDVVQRRAHPRARVPFRYHTAVLVTEEKRQFFLAHPLDLGAGGVRILHRLPLGPGDTFELTFRPRSDVTITLSAEVIESQRVASPQAGDPRPSYITRAKFFDLTPMHQKFLSRYVGWLLNAPRSSATSRRSAG